MDPRKISVKLRRDPRETAERHSQANPLTLECTLASGETVTEAMDLRAELHAAQTPATTPLATTATVVMASGSTGPWELEFSGAQMNQTVLPDSAEDFWLVVYATNAADDLFTLAKIGLTLTFDNISQVTPAPPEPPLYATYAFRTFAVAGQSSVVAETTADTLTLVAGSNITLTTNATTDTITIAASGGGGGGSVTLTGDVTGTGTGTVATTIADGAVTASKIATGAVGATQLASTAVTAGSYTLASLTVDADGRITAASSGTAGTVTAVSVATANGVSGTSSGGATPALTITLGAITPTSVNGVTLSGTSTPTLAVSGTTSVSGTNTGDQTITLTGDVTGSGTGSFAATIAASAVTYTKMQAVSAASRLLGRGTAGGTAVREISLGTGLSMSGDVLSATATGGGTNTILQFFPRDAEFPSTNFATIDTRNNHPCLDFDDNTTETVFFTGFIPQGASFAASGTALTFVLLSTAQTALTGNIGWLVALERIVANSIDIDGDDFGTAQSGSAAVIGGANTGKVTEVSVTFTQAQLPTSLAAGDMIRVRVQRNTSVSGDHTGDAELLGVYANMTPQIP